MSETTVFVTGATGTVGTEALHALRDRAGVRVRAGVRSPEKAQHIAGQNLTPVSFDFQKPGGWPSAFEGVDALFLITPVASGFGPAAKAVVDAAKAAGVRRIVRLSVVGADAEPGIALGRDHREVEDHVRRSGLEWVFLRPNSFMQNFRSYYMPDEHGRIHLPTGDGASSFVDVRDVAAAAAAALTNPAHAGRAYVLTGPRALTTAEVARILSDVSGRTITHDDISPDAMRQAMLGAGVPAVYTESLLELYAIMKAGYTAAVSPDVEKLAGRPARSFEEFARDNAAVWKR